MNLYPQLEYPYSMLSVIFDLISLESTLIAGLFVQKARTPRPNISRSHSILMVISACLFKAAEKG